MGIQTVVIASLPMASALRAHTEGRPETKIFSDAEFLAALETILAETPEVIALDPDFVATARGAALVARVKADPRLKHSQVRVLPREGDEALEAMEVLPGDLRTAATLEVLQLDSCGTRAAPRHVMRVEVESRVNGAASRLVNLSVSGAQVLASQRLRPTEQVRFTLTDESTELRLKGSIAWANLEIGAAGHGSRYRAGLEFNDTDHDVLDRYCQRNRQRSEPV
jgi:hypothetical protein